MDGEGWLKEIERMREKAGFRDARERRVRIMDEERWLSVAK